MALVELINVSKNYRTGSISCTALHPTNLSISNGEFLCISGPSGSGKTTLLNLIGCIDTPSSGTVTIDGCSTSGLSRTKAARLRLDRIGFVFQSHNLIPVLTAFENVEYVLLLHHIPPAERRQMVMTALESVGIAALAGQLPGEMSGGQQQRVAVARAIVSSPALVLADEPTASLDSKTGTDLVALLQQLNHQRGMTFIFSSHDQRIISHAHRIITLEDGSIASDRFTSNPDNDFRPGSEHLSP